MDYYLRNGFNNIGEYKHYSNNPYVYENTNYTFGKYKHYDNDPSKYKTGREPQPVNFLEADNGNKTSKPPEENIIKTKSDDLTSFGKKIYKLTLTELLLVMVFVSFLTSVITDLSGRRYRGHHFQHQCAGRLYFLQ
jgi:hypothetical protein